MRVLIACVAFCTLAIGHRAEAGENKLLGTITSTGTSVNNTTTAVPFSIPAGAKLTLRCDTANGVLLVDQVSVATSGASKGIPVPGTTLFPTSVGKANGSISGNPTAMIALISSTGTTNCDVWNRDGLE